FVLREHFDHGRTREQFASSIDLFRVLGFVCGPRIGLIGRDEAEVRTLLLDQSELERVTTPRDLGPESGLEDPELGLRSLPLLAPPQGLLLDGRERLGRLLREVRGPVRLVAAVTAIRGLLDPELGADLILEAKLPGPGAGSVILPEAAVRDA